ncbi:MAG: SGNH/GDSL hydrolase family protein [bacterium]|nr:SGNH/GDSL hydrolase family protein [bacterium]
MRLKRPFPEWFMPRLMLWVLVLLLPFMSRAQTQADLTPEEAAEAAAIIERLNATPIFHNFESPLIAEVFAHGQAVGNRANVFTKVGDSNTTSGDFLRPIGLRGGRFCRLGEYTDLQTTIDYFSVPPREGYRNSFDSISQAAINGLTSAAALDPFWAEQPPCESGENPLACEYRISRPGVAVIMLGLMDFEVMDADFYRDNMARVIETTLDAGVIPVLTNNVAMPEVETYLNSLRFNAVLLDLADDYQVPLLNLWAAVQPLPNVGIGPDRTHLSHAVGEFCAFDGAQTRYGGTLRNLLTLQALDTLRRTVLDVD